MAFNPKVVVVAVLAVVVLLPKSTLSQEITFPAEVCADSHPRCFGQARAGRCETNPTFMRARCALSCGLCRQEGGNTAPDEDLPAGGGGGGGGGSGGGGGGGGGAFVQPLPNAAAATTTTTTTTTTTITPTTTTTLPKKRRTIVDPGFECGGLLTSHTRARRQAPAAIDPEDAEGGEFGAFDAVDVGIPIIEPFCGASVISERLLLTAASCVDLSPIDAVRLGDLDLATEGENGSSPVDYAIIHAIKHPDYNRDSRYNDIALLVTDRTIQFSDAVFPYCISATKPLPGAPVIAAGYGYYNETFKSSHLLEGDLNVIGIEECQIELLQKEEERFLKAYPNLLEGQKGVLCAHNEQGGVCEGDEGGPLYAEDQSGRRYLEGITSLTAAASRCTEGIAPGVFTAVGDYVDFIDKYLNEF